MSQWGKRSPQTGRQIAGTRREGLGLLHLSSPFPALALSLHSTPVFTHPCLWPQHSLGTLSWRSCWAPGFQQMLKLRPGSRSPSPLPANVWGSLWSLTTAKCHLNLSSRIIFRGRRWEKWLFPLVLESLPIKSYFLKCSHVVGIRKTAASEFWLGQR